MGITRKSLNRTKKKSVFHKSDYKSGDGMLTSVWGPSLWHSLHTISFNYPLNPSMDDKKRYRQFILRLKYVLPCKYCRINLKQNFKCLPLQMKDMKNRETFSRYMYQLHELVNKMLGKKSGLKFCDVKERYEHFRSRCTEENPKIFEFKKKTKKEKGCTEPLYGKKSQCVVKIIPQNKKIPSFQMDKKCMNQRLTN